MKRKVTGGRLVLEVKISKWQPQQLELLLPPPPCLPHWRQRQPAQNSGDPEVAFVRPS
jgi:hypothetical protein